MDNLNIIQIIIATVTGVAIAFVITRQKLKYNQTHIRRLLHAIEQSPASVMITNLNGEIEYVNPKFEQVTGYSADEVIGQNPRLLKSGHTSSEGYKALWQTISNGLEWRGEFHNRKKNGELYWEYASISPTKDESGKITHYVAVKEDITQRKRREQALSESEEKFRMITTAAQDAVLMINHKGLISYCNKATEKIFEYSENELLGQDLHKLLVPKRFYQDYVTGFEKFQKAGQGNAVGKISELVGVKKNAEEFPIELSLSSVKINNQWHAIGLVRDITQRKLSELKLQEADRDRILAETAGAAAHEINQPLSVIMGLTQVILNSADTPSHTWQEDIKYIHEASQKIKEIIGHMERTTVYQTTNYVGQTKIVDFGKKRDRVHIQTSDQT